GPRELLALGRSLSRLPSIRTGLERRRAERLRAIASRLDDVPEVAGRILATLAGEPPATLNDGGAIRDGCDAQLDELRDISRNS
ncbi:MAG TPA: hypothetical protein DEH78_02445, partial [Solibacterales bacterium]|nr:hypothetical protein [Bryobacterales bacterium]